jgi:hypothetical protein
LSQIQTIFCHSNRNSPTRHLFCASLEQLQLKIGIPEPLLQSSYELYGSLATPCWISHIWEYCHSKGIILQPSIRQKSLNSTNPWSRPTMTSPQKQTTDDKFIMHLFAQEGYTNNKLFTLNVCHMYLHAVTLSNIATADSIFVTKQAWNGHRNKSQRSPYHWPRTEQPPNAV